MNSKVRVYDHFGSIAELASVARVSFGKDPIDDLYNYVINTTNERENDEKNFELVKKCYNLGHLSIFEFADVTYFIQCPIFVARQLMRYRCASYIERSLRRCEPEELEAKDCVEEYDYAYNDSVALYSNMRTTGFNKEQARAVLTLATPTQFLMRVNLRELFHIFDERLQKEAQKETREVVVQMFKLFSNFFPDLAGLLLETKNYYDF